MSTHILTFEDSKIKIAGTYGERESPNSFDTIREFQTKSQIIDLSSLDREGIKYSIEQLEILEGKIEF